MPPPCHSCPPRLNAALLGCGGCPPARRPVCGRRPTLAGSDLWGDVAHCGGGELGLPRPYLVPFFFEKVFLTLR